MGELPLPPLATGGAVTVRNDVTSSVLVEYEIDDEELLAANASSSSKLGRMRYRENMVAAKNNSE